MIDGGVKGRADSLFFLSARHNQAILQSRVQREDRIVVSPGDNSRQDVLFPDVHVATHCAGEGCIILDDDRKITYPNQCSLMECNIFLWKQTECLPQGAEHLICHQITVK